MEQETESSGDDSQDSQADLVRKPFKKSDFQIQIEAVKRYAPVLLAKLEKSDEFEESMKKFNLLIEDPIKF